MGKRPFIPAGRQKPAGSRMMQVFCGLTFSSQYAITAIAIRAGKVIVICNIGGMFPSP